MNPLTWNKEQWRDAAVGMALTLLLFTEYYIVMLIAYGDK